MAGHEGDVARSWRPRGAKEIIGSTGEGQAGSRRWAAAIVFSRDEIRWRRPRIRNHGMAALALRRRLAVGSCPTRDSHRSDWRWRARRGARSPSSTPWFPRAALEAGPRQSSEMSELPPVAFSRHHTRTAYHLRPRPTGLLVQIRTNLNFAGALALEVGACARWRRAGPARAGRLGSGSGGIQGHPAVCSTAPTQRTP